MSWNSKEEIETRTFLCNFLS